MNQYDSYIKSDYIPAPYQYYLQAGKMEQDAYNQDRANLEAVQDRLAAIKKREVDVADFNKLYSEFENKGLDILTNNKYASPDLTSEVRRYARQVAKDPRFQGFQETYNKQQELNKQRDALKLQGKIWQYGDDINTRRLLDNSGQIEYSDYNSQGPQFEQVQDYNKAAKEAVEQFNKAMISKSGYSLRNMKGPSGQDAIVMVNKDGKYVADLMNPDSIKDPEIRKQAYEFRRTLRDVTLPNFISEGPGSQFYRRQQLEKANPNYTGPFKDSGEEAAYNLLLSQITPQSLENENAQIVKFAEPKQPGGSGIGGTPLNPSGSITLEEGYNQQADPSGGPLIASPSYGLNNPNTYTQMTPADRAKLYTYTREKYNDYLTDLRKKYPKAGVSYDEFVGNYGRYDAAKPNNPYGKLTEDFLKEHREVADNILKGVIVNNSNPATNKWMSDIGTKSVNNSNALVLGGDYNLLPVGNVLGGSQANNQPVEYTGQNGKIPTIHGGLMDVTFFNQYVTKDQYEKAGFDPDETDGETLKEQVKADGTKQVLFPIRVAVPNNQLYTAKNARLNDFNTYGPDKQIGTEEDYEASHRLLYNKSKLQEYGFDVQIIGLDNTTKEPIFAVQDMQDGSKGRTVTQSQLLDSRVINQVLKELKDAR